MVGPNDAGVKLPKGVKRIKSNYNRVWIIERIYADDADAKDIEKVHQIQNEITVTPLSKYGREGWKPRKPKQSATRRSTIRRCRPGWPSTTSSASC